MKKLFLWAILFLSITLTACSSSVKEKVTGEQAREILNNNDSAVLIDVRTVEEYNAGHIDNSILIPVSEIETITDIILNKNTPIILYCRSGNRSSQAAKALEELGYTKIYDLGSIQNW